MARTSATDVQARRSEILNQLGKHSFMAVEDLSSLLGVSPVTIRRDLDALHSEGQLVRRHGGAVAVENATTGRAEEADVGLASTAEDSQTAQSIERIGAYAASSLNPGDVVLLSNGPISRHLAELIVEFRDLTVITNSVDVFDTLRNGRHMHLVATGGELRHPQRTLVGPLSEASIREIRADKLFLEPSGISEDRQLYCASLPDVPVQQAMIHAAREVIILAEHGTFEKEGIMPVASLDVAARIITDAGMPKERIEILGTEGLDIVRA